MLSASGKVLCPHCGAENRESPIVTTCSRCGGELGPPAPKIDLPPPATLPAVQPAPRDEAWAAPGTEAPVLVETEEVPLPLAPPPREVPLRLRLVVMFGGATSQIGWLFFGIGMVFVWAFGGFADYSPLYIWKGPWQTAQGTITGSRETSVTVNDARVYAHRYTFATPDGRTHEGTSYATGGTKTTGTEVTVQYRAGDASVSRIHGMGGAAMPLWVVPIVLLFPIIGLAFIVPSLVRGWRANRLLGTGKLGTGVLTSMRPTNTRINNRVVYDLAFEFTAEDSRTYEARARTEEPERLQDQRREPVLYDPFEPSYAVMLDSLPGAPTIDAGGQLEAPAFGRLLGALIVPLLTLLGHGTYVCLRLMMMLK